MRIFTPQDQELFAALSGDFNPLHLDPLQARRVLIGRPVVHGLHLLLWALGETLPAPAQLVRLSAVFKSAVGVGDAVACRVEAGQGERLRLICSSAGRDVMTADLDIAAARPSLPIPATTPPREACRDMSAQDLPGGAGEIAVGVAPSAFRALLPGAAAALPEDQVAVLLATTRLIGMHCPGLRSIYSGIDLRFSDATGPAPPFLQWRVRRFDARFSLATIDVAGLGAQGTLTAFLRPKPHAQAPYREVAAHVPAGQFRHQRAVVVGGSRGLGELCGKLLAAGGADVRLTFHRGSEDAHRVAAEIQAAGARAQAVPFDVLAPSSDDASRDLAGWQPTHLYYFATPPIFVAAKAKFSAGLFATFCAYYVTGFTETVRALRESGSGPFFVYYPSSVAVDEPPADMGEYAAAKAAGETACRYLMAADPALNIYIQRLPRVLTDQTATVALVQSEDPLPLLLSMLLDSSSTRRAS